MRKLLIKRVKGHRREIKIVPCISPLASLLSNDETAKNLLRTDD